MSARRTDTYRIQEVIRLHRLGQKRWKRVLDPFFFPHGFGARIRSPDTDTETVTVH